jgi:hypothetical protein
MAARSSPAPEAAVSRKKPTTLTGSGFTAVDLLEHPRLLGASFQPAVSWHAWGVFLRALEGLPITDPADLELFRRCTGRSTAPTMPAAECFVAVSRRAGKSRVASLLAVTAAICTDWKARTAPGETAVIAVLAADRSQARQIFNYAKGLTAASPIIRAHVIDDKADTLTFDTGSSIGSTLPTTEASAADPSL